MGVARRPGVKSEVKKFRPLNSFNFYMKVRYKEIKAASPAMQCRDI